MTDVLPVKNNNPFRPGDEVWFCPQMIGYGYLYGVDKGIPAIVLRVGSRRCTIQFKAKNGALIPPRHVAYTNLVRRPVYE